MYLLVIKKDNVLFYAKSVVDEKSSTSLGLNWESMSNLSAPKAFNELRTAFDHWRILDNKYTICNSVQGIPLICEVDIASNTVLRSFEYFELCKNPTNQAISYLINTGVKSLIDSGYVSKSKILRLMVSRGYKKSDVESVLKEY